MNEFLTTAPFDLYELHLYRLVVTHRSFTKAAQLAGITQSAVTRQMQGMETRLGVELLERTTRSVHITPAGEFLFRESARLVADVDNSLRRLREEFTDARKEVRVGVSNSIGLAYLPGFFHANLRRMPHVGCRVSFQSGTGILGAIESAELDLGVLSLPKRLPRTLRVTHRFEDMFTAIAPRHLAEEFRSLPASRRTRLAWLNEQSWLLLDEGSNTGRQLRAWMIQKGMPVEPTMLLDNFDLIINLVSLGMGVSLVPIRSLALYGRKRNLQRLAIKERFVRELVVVTRQNKNPPPHVTEFITNILF